MPDALPHQLYETLRACGPLTKEQLQSHLGVTQQQVASALDELSALRVVRSDPADDRISVLPTEAAIKELLHEQHEQVTAALERILLQTSTVDRLLRDHPLQLDGERTGLPMTVLTGRDEIEHFLGELTRTTVSSLESMHPGPLPPAGKLAASLAKDRQLLGRGVTVRSLYPASFFAATRLRRYFHDAAEAGLHIRLNSHVPVDLLLADRRTAVLPLNTAEPGLGICVLTGGPVVQSLVQLFECFWHMAAPPSSEAPAPAGELLDDQQTALLKLLSGGMKDERIARLLGVSPRTLSRLISELMAAMNAESRFEAGARAVRLGLLN
ncbi:helix-turn-helix transcriptional regulator [Streptomyces acidiscabies]|uniref:helix-turn-helix transcriptional regulator n=1 Tax=Streptomyces acidiscabies TaxID=42234 RepID=UPI0038F6D063